MLLVPTIGFELMTYRLQGDCTTTVLSRLIGSPTWARTTDQQINSLLLYRLSYWGMIDMAESLGVEPSDRITTVYGLAIRCITVLPALDNLLSRHSSLLQKSGGPSRDRTGD